MAAERTCWSKTTCVSRARSVRPQRTSHGAPSVVVAAARSAARSSRARRRPARRRPGARRARRGRRASPSACAQSSASPRGARSVRGRSPRPPAAQTAPGWRRSTAAAGAAPPPALRGGGGRRHLRRPPALGPRRERRRLVVAQPEADAQAAARAELRAVGRAHQRRVEPQRAAVEAGDRRPHLDVVAEAARRRKLHRVERLGAEEEAALGEERLAVGGAQQVERRPLKVLEVVGVVDDGEAVGVLDVDRGLVGVSFGRRAREWRCGASQRKGLRRRKWSSRRNSRKILRRRTEGEGRNGCKGGIHRGWRSGERD